jgi:hypothetical protein
MNRRDWVGFLKQGAGKEIAIAQLPAAMMNHLGATSNFVYLHHDYALKAVTKHGVDPEHFSLIFDTIDYGRAIADRDLHITFLWDTFPLGWFQVTVKRAFESRRVYISTFYKTNKREALRKLRKYKNLK